MSLQALRNTSISMRATLVFAIVLMGAVGIVLALITGGVYRELAFANQRVAFADLVEIKSADLLGQLAERARALALGVPNTPTFKDALARRDAVELQHELDEQFHQYFVTANVLHLSKLYLFDADFNPVAESSEGDPALRPGERVCPSLLAAAARREGTARLKVLSELCATNGRPYHSTVVAVGGIKAQGYVQVVTDPAFTLRALEVGLGMPVRISLPDRSLAYASPAWPTDEKYARYLMAEDTLHTAQGEHVLTIHIAAPLEGLLYQLGGARNQVIVIAVVATLLAVGFIIYLLQRLTLTPLRSLTTHLRQVRKDKSHLKDGVVVAGNTEVRELAKDFNEMAVELHTLYSTLENMAYTDSLTQLPNRARLLDRIEQVLLRSERERKVFVLMIMDLDRFKEVNDTLGHEYGDRLLQEVSRRLESVLRRSDTAARLGEDTVARLGGDEFALLLPTAHSADGAATVARKVVEELGRPCQLDEHTINIGVSIGIALYPHDGNDTATLMRHADVAMYQAKTGRRGFTFYDKDQDESSLQNLLLTGELRHAIQNDGLQLHYQPKIDLGSGKVCGVEALARWKHAERGFIPPDKFIPLAERNGLIQPLTEWVLHSALRQVAAWRAMGINVGVAVNLSALSLHDPGLPEHVLATLRDCKVPAGALGLELTESAVMADPERAMEIMGYLSAMGVRLAVDDFGTGYSSLAYLKRLPVSELKIDRSFVMDMQHDRQDAIIVRSTIDLAHNMSLKVVAEGIEDAATYHELRKLRCDMAQGYYMGRPVAPDELAQWIRHSPWGNGPGP